MPTRACKHKQGMAKEREPEPVAAMATGIEGPRTNYEHEVHNAATPVHLPTERTP